jgi:hypothetical protein
VDKEGVEMMVPLSESARAALDRVLELNPVSAMWRVRVGGVVSGQLEPPPQATAPVTSMDKAQQEEQYHSADEGDEDGAGETAEGRLDVEAAKEPAAYEGTNDPDNDVADEAVAAPHHKRGEHSGNEADDKPGQQIHVRLLIRHIASAPHAPESF